MIRKLIMTSVLLLITCHSFALDPKDNQKYTDPNYVDKDYATPSPYKMTKVVKITIMAASVLDEIEPKEKCTTFIIKPKLATFFFNHSRPVSEAARMHQHVVSACGAEGKVKFANGDEADWTIKRGGIAFMQMLNGKFKDKVVILYCEKCEDWGL